MVDSITLSSFNCRGLRNIDKRIGLFHWLKDMHKGIIFLQETHSIESDETTWKREWGSKIYFSHCSTTKQGVAILMPSNVDINISKVECDKDGRLIALTCLIEENELVLINIYAPTKDKYALQIKFLNYLHTIIDKYSDKRVMIGGDFNVCLNPSKDKLGGRVEEQSPYCKNLINLLEEYSLIDIWRIRNDSVKQFTRREKSRSGLVQSRLDYWFISSSLQYCTNKVYIKPGYQSDHSILDLHLQLLEIQRRGKGTWKFNNGLLNDKTYVNLIKSTILKVIKEVNFDDKNLLWEFLKCQIRSDTILYSGQKAKHRRQREMELSTKLDYLEKNLDKNECNYVDYQLIKTEWENLQNEKTKGAMVRSKAKWVEYGEKNSKYFFNLEKRNYSTKYIKKIIKPNGTETSEPNEILQEQVGFYADLYSCKCKEDSYTELRKLFLNNSSIPKLDMEAKQLCNEPLSLLEISNALKEMALDKSPGPDGLTTNFYKCFWDDLKQPLLDSYLFAFKHGELADGQRRGTLNLIPKKDKDLRYLKSWRPVSLLATDYKILAKALAIRLQKVISSLVHPDQVGYIKGRYIGENIITINDLIQTSSIYQKPGILALIDFEKAFDTVEWSFLFETLETFDLGGNFATWIRLLYTNIFSCITNNGYISNYFPLSRGIRQGCPISALLFILVAEILSINVRSDASIKGITIKETEFKIAQLADDTTVFLSDIQSLKQVITRFNKFGLISGLKVNLDKTELIPLGGYHLQHSQLKGTLKGIKPVNGPFKTLGVWFTKDIDLANRLNFIEKVENIKKILNIWKSRTLSWKGKITILKSLIVPQLIHLLGTVYVPNSLLETIDKVFLDFLWSGKPPRIKKSTIISGYGEGGLKMPDIYSIHASQKIMWIKRLTDNNNRKWKKLEQLLLGIDINLFSFKLPENMYKQPARTQYHRQLLECWFDIKNCTPIHCNEIMSEYLLYNKYIQIGGSCLTESIINQNKEYLKTQIKDLLDSTGCFLNFEDFKANLPFKMSQLEYRGLIHAIPKNWQEKLKTKPGRLDSNPTDLSLKVKNRVRPLNKLSSKDIYWELINRKSKCPTSLETRDGSV